VEASGPLRLYAIVPADDARALGEATRVLRPVLRLVPCGPVLAITGQAGREPVARASLRHDRIVGRALEACSSVVPFRLGVELRSEAALEDLLAANLPSLRVQLSRFSGRVEMGFKARLAAVPAGKPMSLPFDLARLRALAPSIEDRREHLERARTGQIFEGCYLIARQAIAAFWSAVEELRRATTELPVLASGPWAAYSFCDFTLRPAPVAHADRHPAQ